MSADLDGTLRGLPAPPPPPLGAALEAELAALQPVKTRKPMRDLVRVAGLSLAYGAALVGLVTVRDDVHLLPPAVLIGYGLAWLLGFLGLAYLAVVPRPGSVMPRWRAAALASVLVSLGFVATGLIMHPTGAAVDPGLGHLHLNSCLPIGLTTALVPVVLGALVLRGAVPVGSRWTAAGLGAAGGSLGGLVLHLHCPIADGWHLGVVHGGVVVLSALLAAALVPRITDRR